MGDTYSLLFRLEGPMQSWGFRSRFDHRDTALEPTRSGIIGLICAAMGIGRGEDISRFEQLRMGVCVEKEGRPECDYHTAMNVIKADGGKGGTVVSRRDYLADASFIVGLQSSNKALLEDIAKALCDPVWPLFLGRKSFPLSVPPLSASSSDWLKVGELEEHLFLGRQGKRCVLEIPDGELIQHDWPVCFGERQFLPRSIKVCFADAQGKGDRI